MPQRADQRSSTGRRRGLSAIGQMSLWEALSKTPGVGLAISDAEGRALFVNDTTMSLFSGGPVEWRGKKLADFHPPEFVEERLRLFRQVIEGQRPVAINHIYRGRRIQSTIWPIRDPTPPHDRVIIVSQAAATGRTAPKLPQPEQVFETAWIDLGPLDVLTRRELEVLALLGHGMSVPKAAELLHRSPKTIQRHKEAISAKLDVRGQAELVAIVATMGLTLTDTELRRMTRERPTRRRLT